MIGCTVLYSLGLLAALISAIFLIMFFFSVAILARERSSISEASFGLPHYNSSYSTSKGTNMEHNYSVGLFQLYIQGLGNDQDLGAIGHTVSQTSVVLIPPVFLLLKCLAIPLPPF